MIPLPHTRPPRASRARSSTGTLRRTRRWLLAAAALISSACAQTYLPAPSPAVVPAGGRQVAIAAGVTPLTLEYQRRLGARADAFASWSWLGGSTEALDASGSEATSNHAFLLGPRLWLAGSADALGLSGFGALGHIRANQGDVAWTMSGAEMGLTANAVVWESSVALTLRHGRGRTGDGDPYAHTYLEVDSHQQWGGIFLGFRAGYRPDWVASSLDAARAEGELVPLPLYVQASLSVPLGAAPR